MEADPRPRGGSAHNDVRMAQRQVCLLNAFLTIAPPMPRWDGLSCAFRSRTLTASKSQVEGFAGGFHSPDRRLAVYSGVFSLVGTLVGGGTLSVPWAVAQCGVGLGLLLLCFFGAISALSVTYLLSAARRCGGLRTYDAVLERMWGPAGRLVAIISVLITCFLSLVAIQILLRQLASPLASQFVLGRALDEHESIALGSGLTLAIVPLTFLQATNSIICCSTILYRGMATRTVPPTVALTGTLSATRFVTLPVPLACRRSTHCAT